MDLVLFALRVIVGLLFVGHGAQKLFGAFGGGGLTGTAENFEKLGLRPGRLHAIAGGSGEFLGGLLLALGLLTPFAAAALIGAMATAIWTVHMKNGPWVTKGGYEYNLVLIAVAFALAGLGAGGWSLDNALGLDMTGDVWALSALAAGLIGGALAVLSGRFYGQRRAGHPDPHPAG